MYIWIPSHGLDNKLVPGVQLCALRRILGKTIALAIGMDVEKTWDRLTLLKG